MEREPLQGIELSVRATHGRQATARVVGICSVSEENDRFLARLELAPGQTVPQGEFLFFDVGEVEHVFRPMLKGATCDGYESMLARVDAEDLARFVGVPLSCRLPTRGPLRLSLEWEPREFAADEAIDLAAVIENVGRKPVRFPVPAFHGRFQPGGRLKIEVEGPHGKAAYRDPNAAYSALFAPPIKETVVLAPGEHLRLEVRLSSWFLFPVGGHYDLRAVLKLQLTEPRLPFADSNAECDCARDPYEVQASFEGSFRIATR